MVKGVPVPPSNHPKDRKETLIHSHLPRYYQPDACCYGRCLPLHRHPRRRTDPHNRVHRAEIEVRQVLSICENWLFGKRSFPAWRSHYSPMEPLQYRTETCPSCLPRYVSPDERDSHPIQRTSSTQYSCSPQDRTIPQTGAPTDMGMVLLLRNRNKRSNTEQGKKGKLSLIDRRLLRKGHF